MPVTFRYDEDKRRLATRCDGEVRLDDVLGHFRELMSLSRLRPGSDVLLDFTFLTTPPSTEQLALTGRKLEEMSEFLRFGRCAIVAPGLDR